jgi:hypothetical protein
MRAMYLAVSAVLALVSCATGPAEKSRSGDGALAVKWLRDPDEPLAPWWEQRESRWLCEAATNFGFTDTQLRGYTGQAREFAANEDHCIHDTSRPFLCRLYSFWSRTLWVYVPVSDPAGAAYRSYGLHLTSDGKVESISRGGSIHSRS